MVGPVHVTAAGARMTDGVSAPSLRDAIVASARGWLGTPYHHQMSVKAVGCDCLGLVRGIWRETYGCEPEGMPAYSRDWAEASGEEALLAAARRHFLEIATKDATGGDILVFRYRRGAAAKHIGVLTAPTTLIHAIEGAPACEIVLTPWWRRRAVAAFAFPGQTC